MRLYFRYVGPEPNFKIELPHTIMTTLDVGSFLPLIFLLDISDVHWVRGKKLAKLKDLIHVPTNEIPHFK